jgi:GTPase
MTSSNNSFRMPVNGALHVKSVGRVVAVGLIAQGSVKPGDKLFVRSRLGSFPVVVKKLEHPTQQLAIARAGQIKGYPTGNVSLDIVMERRKALEWLYSSCDWDNVDLST